MEGLEINPEDADLKHIRDMLWSVREFMEKGGTDSEDSPVQVPETVVPHLAAIVVHCKAGIDEVNKLLGDNIINLNDRNYENN